MEGYDRLRVQIAHLLAFSRDLTDRYIILKKKNYQLLEENERLKHKIDKVGNRIDEMTQGYLDMSNGK